VTKSDSFLETWGAYVRTLVRDQETLGSPQETLGDPSEALGDPLETLDSSTCILGDSATCTHIVETSEDGCLVQSDEDCIASPYVVVFGAPQSAAYAATQKMHFSSTASPALWKTVVEDASEVAKG
jgi:hypothetical protein